MQQDQPLQVARCTKIITAEGMEPRYMINVKQFAKFVVDLADTIPPTDIEEGMRVGVDCNKFQIHLPLPAKIDPSVTMMQVEEKPDVTYADVGGCTEHIEKLREVVETLLLHIGFGAPVRSFDGSEGSVKNQIISLILAGQTDKRMPLIGINILVIFKLLLG